MTVREYLAAATLPANEWDSLNCGATAYSRSGWLATREEELPAGAHARYLIARDSCGSATAAMETYLFPSAPHRLYAPRHWFDGVVGDDVIEKLESHPFVVGAGWSEFRGQLPSRMGLAPDDWSAAVEELTRSTMEFARAQGAQFIAYLFVPLEQARALAAANADSRSSVVLHDVESVLATDWPSFDDYLEWLPRNRRTRVKRELRRFQQSGRTIREVALDQAIDVVAPLHHQLMQKYGHDWYTLKRAQSVYERQARHLAGDSSVLLVDDPDGSHVGCAVRYRSADHLYSRVVGFDYTKPNASDYFNVLMYEPVRTGSQRGISDINLGLGTYEAKLGRGAQPVPLYNVFVGVGEMFDLPQDAVNQRNLEKVTAFLEEFGRLVVGGARVESWLPSTDASHTSWSL